MHVSASLACSSADLQCLGSRGLLARTEHIVNVIPTTGDSRAVLSRRGKAIVLTRDHKPLDPQEQQRIECAGGFVCADDRLCGRLSVSRAIGDFHYKEKLKGDPTAGKLMSSKVAGS